DRQGDETWLIAPFHPVGPRTTKISLAGPLMNKFPGGHRGRVPPVPIPNTEVKPATADGTACAGVWESRSLPGLFCVRVPVVRCHNGLFSLYGVARTQRRMDSEVIVPAG